MIRKQPWLSAGVVAVFAATATAQPLVRPAIAIAPIIEPGRAETNYFQGATLLQRVQQSQLIVRGTIAATPRTVEIKPYPQAPISQSYKVFTLKVEETLAGDAVKELTLLVPAADPYVMAFNGQQQPNAAVRPWINNVQVIDGQEGVFFLMSQPNLTGSYAIVPGAVPLNPLSTKYKEHLAKIQQIQAIYKDPLKALKTDVADDRLTASIILTMKYRSYPPNAPSGVEEVPIDAEVSKLLLATLLEQDFARYDVQPNGLTPPDYYERSPVNLVNSLGIQAGTPGFPQFIAVQGTYHTTFKALLKEYLESDAGKKFVVKTFKPLKLPK